MEPLYVVYRYGPLGVADTQYVRVRKNDRIEWVADKSRASVFKLARAKALARGYRAVSNVDLVVESVSFWNP